MKNGDYNMKLCGGTLFDCDDGCEACIRWQFTATDRTDELKRANNG